MREVFLVGRMSELGWMEPFGLECLRVVWFGKGIHVMRFAHGMGLA